MTRKATTKKATPKKTAAKKTTAKKPATKAKPAHRAKRTKAFTVQRKVYGVYGETFYTDPSRVFATPEAAQRHADELNRELLAVSSPFRHYGAVSLIKGGDSALTALVTKMGLALPTKTTGVRLPVLDWADWWNANYFNMTDAQRDALCTALDKFDWYVVRTTTLE